MPTVAELIIELKTKSPGMTPEDIAAFVRKTIPGARTSAGSVVCTLSRSKVPSGGRIMASEIELSPATSELLATNPEESLEDAKKRIAIRYNALKRMSDHLVKGKIPSLIVSGPPGMSKSFTVTEALNLSGRHRHDGFTNVGGGGPSSIDGVEHPGWYDHIGGACTAVGLFHALWNMRKGGVLYLDDCDEIFRDPDAVNLLKVATDSTKERLVSWRKNSMWLEEYGIEKTFDFQGHIVFLTNIDFEHVIARGSKESEHFKALIDRASYLCLTLRNRRDFMIQITKVCIEDKMLAKAGLNKEQSTELLEFLEKNQERFYNLSIRLATHCVTAMKADPVGWKADIEATKMRTL